MNQAMLLLFLLGCFLLGGCVSVEDQPPAAVKPDPPVVRAAECRWATGPIRIDGRLDEAAWQKAPVLRDFAVFWQKRAARTATKARLLWDDLNLYFAAEMEDTDLYADVTEANGMTWTNDVFELFFKPAVDDRKYYEFQVNAAGTQLELFFPSRGSGGYQRFKGKRLGMASAVTLQGTLNHWEDTDTGWTVEGRIPWTAFASSGGRPKSGAKWRFALCRYDYSVAFEEAELSSTAPLTLANFHRYEDYGELTFVGP
jgi:cellulose/xylan binding protein with CBM9 domain